MRSIVAEYFHFRGQTISTTGLGAIISEATDGNNFRLLLAATVVTAMIVVSMKRLSGVDSMLWLQPVRLED